jgi:hypothetical protein
MPIRGLAFPTADVGFALAAVFGTDAAFACLLVDAGRAHAV